MCSPNIPRRPRPQQLLRTAFAEHLKFKQRLLVHLYVDLWPSWRRDECGKSKPVECQSESPQVLAGHGCQCQTIQKRKLSPPAISPQLDRTHRWVATAWTYKSQAAPVCVGPVWLPRSYQDSPGSMHSLPHCFPAAKNKASSCPEPEVTATMQSCAQLPLSALTSLLLSRRVRNIIANIFLNIQRHLKKKSLFSLFLQFHLAAKYIPRSIGWNCIKLHHQLWTQNPGSKGI